MSLLCSCSSSCYSCTYRRLSCNGLLKGELCRRHDAVVDAVERVAWQVGAQVRKEVEGLDPDSKQRPDLQIVFPGRMLLADVCVSHPLTARAIMQNRSTASSWQSTKNRKYAGVASHLGAELMNVCVADWRRMRSGWYEP